MKPIVPRSVEETGQVETGQCERTEEVQQSQDHGQDRGSRDPTKERAVERPRFTVPREGGRKRAGGEDAAA